MSEDAKEEMPNGDEEPMTPTVIPCFKCDNDCWRRGWLLLPDEEEEGGVRNNICDDCLLFHKKVKGAERRFDGKIKPNAPKKPKPAPKKKKATAIKKKPAAAKNTRK
jgi:hypothetical protein